MEEYGQFNILKQENDGNNDYVISDGLNVAYMSLDPSFEGASEDQVVSNLEKLADSFNGDRARYVEENSYGQVMGDVPYVDILFAGPREDKFASGQRMEFRGEGLNRDIISINEDGSVNVNSSQEYELSDYNGPI